MIKKEDVIDKAKIIMPSHDVRDFLRAIEMKRWTRADLILGRNFYSIQRMALESVYNGDCDIAIFNRYRKAKDAHIIYTNFKDEHYAVGT